MYTICVSLILNIVSFSLSLRHIPQKDKQEYELPLEYDKESENDSDSMDIDQ